MSVMFGDTQGRGGLLDLMNQKKQAQRKGQMNMLGGGMAGGNARQSMGGMGSGPLTGTSGFGGGGGTGMGIGTPPTVPNTLKPRG
jgi:hypothetical protein